MVITCPSCSARYRLNPDKIRGRGAKITCPKCSHIFVVFSDATTANANADPAAPKKPRSPDADMPDAPVGRDADTTSGAFQAVGLDEGDVSATTGNIRVVAPGPRKTRRVRALSRENMPTTKQIGSTAEVPAVAEGDDASEPPKNAADLDFRSVGITTWKVKVSIGLIYDFSDISTLKKYLADKKVTEDDLISHDAKDWIRLGDIPNLDQHFIDAWIEAKAAGAGNAPKKEKKAPDSGGVGSGTGSYGASTGSYSAQATQRTGSHRSTTTQTVRSPARRPKRPAKPEPEESGRGRMVAIAAGILIALGGAWFFIQRGSGDPGSTVAGGASTPEDAAREEMEDQSIKDEISEGIKKRQEELRAKELAKREAEKTRREAEEKVRREAEAAAEARHRLEALASGQHPGGPGSTPRPRRTPRPRSTPRARTTPTQGSAQASTKQNSYLTYLGHARTKLGEGNFGSAMTFVDQALSKNPNCGECYETRAEIKQKTGDPAGAAADLAQARKLGSTSARVSQ